MVQKRQQNHLVVFLDKFDIPIKVCIYIAVISLGFVCLFENRFARESKGMDQNL